MIKVDYKFDFSLATNDQLAFLGDAVYSLLVREMLCKQGLSRSKELHFTSAGFVRASAQAAALKSIEPLLSEEEFAVYKRGRNSHINNIPKGATVGEYHTATGLECLFGFLYLKNEQTRINELFEEIFKEAN